MSWQTPEEYALPSLDGMSPWLYALALGSFRARFGTTADAWAAEWRFGTEGFCEIYAAFPRGWSDETRARERRYAELAFTGYHLGWDEGVPGVAL